MSLDKLSTEEYSKFIHRSRYARWIEKESRREEWEETVQRLIDFWMEESPEYFSEVKDKIFDGIYNLKFMPSMRSLMTAGKALHRDHVAGYNCAYTAIDNPKAFDEILYILLNGTGVGYSVERQYIVKLPEIAEEFYHIETKIIVPDSKIGWASSFRQLISLLYQGQIPSWDTSKVRPAGSILKTFGGRSSGPEPLEELFHFAIKIFSNAAGRRLNSIECHDLVCKIADIVVVGGVRRAALISFSNLTDQRMRDAKKGQWWLIDPQRALANNSVCYTEKPDMGIFIDEWKALYQSKSGERGIYNAEAAYNLLPERRKEINENNKLDIRSNPCCLPYETKVTTNLGDMEIGKIIEQGVSNFNVLTYNIKKDSFQFEKIITGALTRPNAELIELVLLVKNKKIKLTLTPDHNVYTMNRGYVQAKDLNFNDEFITDFTVDTCKLFSKTHLKERKDTYDLQTKQENFFANSILVHNSEINLRNKEFCNLTEVIVRPEDDLESLKEKVELATIMGTFQSTLTNFRYLSSAWKKNCDEERLLGVSLTGIMDNILLSGKSGKDLLIETLEKLKQVAIDVNLEWSNKLGIEQSKAITCVKPSGNTCTTKDTLIKTSNGNMTLGEIFKFVSDSSFILDEKNSKLDFTSMKRDLFVFDENNDKQLVTGLYNNGIAEVYEIEFEDGKIYKFTDNHKLKTTNGWKKVMNLTEDDIIISY